MDTGIIKPRDPVAQRDQGRSRSIVRTELAPSQSVAAAPATAPLRNNSAGDVVPVLIDAQNRELADRERDIARRSGRRAPDEALQRMRAYGRTPAQHHDPDQDDHADIEA